MVGALRFSSQILAVLHALLRAPAEWRYGYDLSRETELKSGTLYPILIRLAERHWVESRWHQADDNGKPRHMYRLTADGRRAARSMVKSEPARRRLQPSFQEE
ncbi:MAG: PadR family transcriptional regulator [Candidatus Angelobacter sp. Gp1-AA117]|nr:MAG: PadR family transcriptional regulator [Candidatus Angelobacter sp. Gp1-AA117]